MNFVKGKPKGQILEEMTKTGEVGSSAHEQQKMGIIVRCSEDIEKALNGLSASLDNSARQADVLSNRVFWLNLVIALAAIAGVVIEIFKLIKGQS